jgi:hypothetical protein
MAEVVALRFSSCTLAENSPRPDTTQPCRKHSVLLQSATEPLGTTRSGFFGGSTTNDPPAKRRLRNADSTSHKKIL